MTIYDFAFYAVSYAAVPFWLLMIFLPRWTVTSSVLRSPYIILLFTLPYALLVLPHFSDILLFLNPTPEKIEELLQRPYSDVLAWIHFIPLDLFVGRWIHFDSQRLKLPYFLMIPVLTLCFLLPPLGISLYLITRLIMRGNASDSIVATA